MESVSSVSFADIELWAQGMNIEVFHRCEQVKNLPNGQTSLKQFWQIFNQSTNNGFVVSTPWDAPPLNISVEEKVLFYIFQMFQYLKEDQELPGPFYLSVLWAGVVSKGCSLVVFRTGQVLECREDLVANTHEFKACIRSITKQDFVELLGEEFSIHLKHLGTIQKAMSTVGF